MKSWLKECRNRLASRGAHWLVRLFGLAPEPRFAEVCAGEEASPEATRYYQLLVDSGKVVWGAIVQANHRAFLPGNDDLPAVVAFSPDREFDDDPNALQDIARRVFALKGQAPDEPDPARIARLISDETAEFHRERLPASLAGRRELYISTFIVNRRRLPTGRLTLQLLPLLVDPARSPVVMILLTDIDSAANLTGVVLDFRSGVEGSGFVFRDA